MNSSLLIFPSAYCSYGATRCFTISAFSALSFSSCRSSAEKQIVQCKNGIDTIVEDYKKVPGWDNPYIQNHVVALVAEALKVQDVAVAYEINDGYFYMQRNHTFKSAARIFFDYDRIEFYDEDHSYDEDRYNTIGDTSAGRISQKAEGALIGNIDQFIGKMNEILFVVYQHW